MDNAKNFAKVTVSTGYDADDTSIVLTTGHGTKLPTAPFNAVWWNATDYGDPSDDPNVEIVRVTNVSTDTLTVTRAQESTSASTKNTGGKTYKMIAGLTAKGINEDLQGWERIASAQLGSANATLIDASGISTDYDLFRITYHIINSSAGDIQPKLQFNSDTGANYETADVYGDSSTLSGFRRTAESQIRLQGASQSFNSGSGENVISGTLLVTKPLSGQFAFVSGNIVHWEATEIKPILLAGRWTNTASKITGIKISASANSFDAGSSVTIEGRKIT